MSVRTWLGAMVTVAAALVLLSGPALALPSAEVPADVRAVLDGVAQRAAPELAGGDDPADIQAVDVHEVYRFTADFLRGRRVDVAVVHAGAWLAVLQRDDVVLGTVRVAAPDGAEPAVTRSDEDVELAQALASVATGELVVEDPKSGALFGLDADSVRPLNDWARLDLNRPSRLSDLQRVLAAQLGLDRSDSGASRDWWLHLAGWVGAGALALAALTVLVLRPQRTARPHRAGRPTGT
jgi:hypothetical protein